MQHEWKLNGDDGFWYVPEGEDDRGDDGRGRRIPIVIWEAEHADNPDATVYVAGHRDWGTEHETASQWNTIEAAKAAAERLIRQIEDGGLTV